MSCGPWQPLWTAQVRCPLQSGHVPLCLCCTQLLYLYTSFMNSGCNLMSRWSVSVCMPVCICVHASLTGYPSAGVLAQAHREQGGIVAGRADFDILGLKYDNNQRKAARSTSRNTKGPAIVTILSNCVPAMKILQEPRFLRFVPDLFQVRPENAQHNCPQASRPVRVVPRTMRLCRGSLPPNSAPTWL